MSIAFLVTALVIVVTPGTGVLYTLATGLSMGARAALVAAFACTLGIVPHLAAAITGLAALLHASAEAFEAIRIAGVAYLLWMAWVTWRDRTPLAIDSGTAAYSAPRIVSRGILINLLNPKLTIFFVAFLPQFIDPTAADQLTPMLTLSGVFMGLTLVVFAGYGVFAAGVRRHVIERPRVVTWMRRGFAACFVSLGAQLARSQRG
jgi:threonine/homoserine/homoserine lactone efflux protein